VPSELLPSPAVETGPRTAGAPDRLLPRTEPLFETADGERSPKTHAHAHVDRLGRYLVDECIGSGGMGEVFRGFDPELDRAVAIKRLVAFGTDDEARIRLQREAQAIARLSHPHVVQVFDVGRDGPTGDLFIAMELVDGVTLRQWLRQTPRT